MKVVRRFIFIAVTLFLAATGIFTFNRLTDGFSIHQMSSSLPPYPQFEVPFSSLEEKERLQSLLEQPFHYIGKGCQFYAFESADGKYVIKFLKHKHLRPFKWLQKLPLTAKWRRSAEEKTARRQLRAQRLFSSCKLAFEAMPQETELLYIHLNRTKALEKKIQLIDKLGFKHLVDVDQHEFVLQKRALKLEEVFSKISTNEEAKERIAQLVDLILARCDKGIADRDRSFAQNVAFSAENNCAIFIDIGQFYQAPEKMSDAEKQAEVEKRLGNLRHWMSRYFPQFVSEVDKYK